VTKDLCERSRPEVTGLDSGLQLTRCASLRTYRHPRLLPVRLPILRSVPDMASRKRSSCPSPGLGPKCNDLALDFVESIYVTSRCVKVAKFLKSVSGTVLVVQR
jgi:hypothetical protein